MGLDDLDVPVGTERPGGAADQRSQEVHPEAHVARAHQGSVATRGFEPREVGSVEARGADDVGDAGLRRQGRISDRCRRQGEVEHALGRDESFERVLGDGNADRAHAGQNPGVLTQCGGSRPRQRRGQRDAVRPRHGRDEHSSHAPRSAGDDEPHVGHPFPS